MANILSRIAPVATAALLSVVLLGATTNAAFANRGAPDYRLTPETSLTGSKIARDTLWRCGEAGCTAAKATSRPEIVCVHAVREMGKVTSFSFRGTEFSAEALAACNAKAR
jgi:uncharacterized low-complexity protein